MFAKVQKLQQNNEARTPVHAPTAAAADATRPATVTQQKAAIPPPINVNVSDKPHTGSRTPSSTPSSASRKSRSPASGKYASVSDDGIRTITRQGLISAGAVAKMDALLGIKKPSLYEDKLIQSVRSSEALGQLTMQAKRTETLSQPKKKPTARKFATDDDAKHCRFRTKSKKKNKGSSGGFDDDATESFIARMEAAERNRQKKLALTRGENHYQGRQDKKYCPKCDIPQSYSELRDKKKRCQMCGSEFRVPTAWGDIGQGFISRQEEAARALAENRERILMKVVEEETNAMQVRKTAKQQFYEKQMIQKNNHKTFLDRNYQTTSTSKTKQAQLEIQMQMQAQRAKLMTTAPAII
ncbi:TPA: hypothetical protein N0F65_004469 [Lagenidium giganteum]|uniref:Uncharacterized protein n=1 Tax=Lagenidium giganteum TaxID=4803 RepID=A0AAV2ZIJ9_9STRA|nr:TPA: hypothetical protein N0F65_004469 [Lagenidium giganteum]